MNKSRRNFLTGSAALSVGLLAKGQAAAQHTHGLMGPPAHTESNASPVAVQTNDIPKLSWTMDGGVKVFDLRAEVVKRAFIPGKVFDVWGYNGQCPGPTIEVNEGDRVRFVFRNNLPEPSVIHWHGLEIPIAMDGVPSISQPPVDPGGTFTYEFTLHQNGTFFYHSHMAMQEMMGMIGLFVIHPKTPYTPRVDKDFGIILQEWAILPNNTVPNSLSMEFNWLTFNGKAGPDSTPLIVRLGDRVRIRLVNLGMDHHPIHLHGNHFYVTGTEAGRRPESTWYPENTVLVGVAQARDIEFDAKYPGDWMLHCHLPHHMMNQMASMVGPMTAGSGMPAGMGMEEGMGMVRDSGATSEQMGPSMGRATGLAAWETPQSTLVGRQKQTQPMDMSKMGGPQPTSNTNQQSPRKPVPGYPQDMLMEMDEAVTKPETYGLAQGWTASMMGMMSVVRVLPPDMYDKVMEMIRKGAGADPQTPGDHHIHGS